MGSNSLKPFDTDGTFSHGVNASGLTRHAARGVGVNVLFSAIALVIQTISTVVLARLLRPHDFGMLAMVTTFSLLLTNFGVNGITEATIQREEIDDAISSNLFWINLAGGSLLTLCFAAAGSLLAWFYGTPQLQGIAMWVSTSIFITSTSVQHRALLMRAMRFSAVSTNDLVARFFSVALSIALAWAGWGYWALVAGIIATSASTSIGAWFLCRWIPSKPRRRSGTVSMLWFAINAYGRFTINYFARNADNLLVGRLYGTVSLGYYKRAYDLFAMPASQLGGPLTQVALSTLSRISPLSDQYRQRFLKALSILALVSMGLSGELTLVGKDLILLVLGPKWREAGRIFTFFGPGVGAMLIYNSHGWIHLSIGKADRWLRWGLVELGITLLCFIAAAPWGPSGFALAWAISFWILLVPGLWYAGRPIGFRVSMMLDAVWRYVLACVLAACTSELLCQLVPLPADGLDPLVAFVSLVLRSALFAPLYLGAVVLLHRGYGPLALVAGFIREMTSSQAPVSAVRAPAVAALKDSPNPLVSILIPAHNAQQWIADTIRSALGQTWRRKEIIVVDDGSTDCTLAIVSQFASDGVRVISQANQGAAAARNTALSLSDGRYIQWLDADDLLAPDKIARQLETLSDSPSPRTLLSSAFGRFSYRYYRAKFTPTALWCDLSPLEWMVRKLGENAYMQTGTWLVSRELTEAAGLWDTRLLGDDDGEYFCRVLLASDGVRFVSSAFTYYRAPFPSSLSGLWRSERKLRAHWLSMQLHIGYLRSLADDERTRCACLRFLQDNLFYFYPECPDLLREIEETARQLGGKLSPPRLSWKYSWLLRTFGWTAAKRLRIFGPRAMWAIRREWDKLLFSIETGDDAAQFPNHDLTHNDERAAERRHMLPGARGRSCCDDT